MEKVKITQKQADALEMILNSNESKYTEGATDWEKATMVKAHVSNIEPSWGDGAEPLNELTVDDFIKALYVGYEVEPEFKVGDWASPKLNGYLGSKHPQKVARIEDGLIKGKVFLEDGLWSYASQLKVSTPQEIATEKTRRWWAKHGRDPYEIKENDLLSNVYEGVRSVYRVHEKDYLLDEGAKWITNDDLKENWLVACFAQDRKDI